MRIAVGAATLSHQETTDESQWKAENSQTYTTASEILCKHSSLHITFNSTVLLYTFNINQRQSIKTEKNSISCQWLWPKQHLDLALFPTVSKFDQGMLYCAYDFLSVTNCDLSYTSVFLRQNALKLNYMYCGF